MNMSSWFKGLKGRLFLSAIIPVAAAVVSSGLSYRSMNMLGSQLSESYTHLNPNIMLLGKINEGRAGMSDGLTKALLFHGNEDLRNNAMEYFESSMKEYKESKEAFMKAPDLPEEKGLIDSVQNHEADFMALTSEAVRLIKLNTKEADAEAQTILQGKWLQYIVEIDNSVDAIRAVYGKASEARLALQEQTRTFAFNVLALVGFLSVVLTMGSLMWTAFSVTRLIRQVSGKLTSSSDEVNASVEQLTNAGESLSHSSSASAASLEETVAALEEMSSMIQMNSDNAKQAASLSVTSKDAAERGEREIKTLVQSMHEISQSSRKIEEIIDVIDDIAFQTNLLALNASVEAARAGEHGKGFAVVAEAVRTLAQRSATAAKEITTLIKHSVEQIESGAKTANTSGVVMNEIVTSVKKVSDLSNEISAASSEQSTGIQQISKAMNQLDQGAQQNAASSEEIAASAREIETQTASMQNHMGDLNYVILGERSVAAEHAAPVKPTHNSAPSSQPAAQILKLEKKAAAIRSAAPKSSPAPVAKKTAPTAAAMIPFDDDADDPRTKIKDTSGF